jgi:dimethylhistidine N-methyltransferase
MIAPGMQHGQQQCHHLRLADFEPELGSFRDEVLGGLRKPQKELPSKFFYDERGSQLFEQICALDEYYLTRTELGIMRDHAGDMAEVLGQRCLLVEYGSGSSTKTRLLLNQLREPAAYVPIDISKAHLIQAASALAAEYPALEVLPVCADYTTDFALPVPTTPSARRVVYYPGSTIGNFDREPALHFLRHIAQLCGPGGGLLIGVDLSKDPVKLHHAYNDWEGVTAAFNLNLLARINRELGADFALDRFRHYAFYNPREGRVEMHLVSLANQTARVGDAEFPFEVAESIWTESSYKYGLAEFASMAGAAGFTVEQVWMDPQDLFSVHYLTVAVV